MPPIARIVGHVALFASLICLVVRTSAQEVGAYRQGAMPAGPAGSRVPFVRPFAGQPHAGQVVPTEFQVPLPAEQSPVVAGADPVPTPAESADPDTGRLSLPPRDQKSGLALAPRGSGDGTGGGRTGGLSSLVTAGSSLAVVLGIFFVLAWMMRRATPGGLSLLPTEVVEMLGRAPLASRQQVHLLRLGKKLLLVSVTQAGVETLSEVTEPEEVDRLAGICRQAQPGSSTETFRHMLQQITGDGDRRRGGSPDDASVSTQ